MQDAMRSITSPGARRAVAVAIGLAWTAALPLDVATTRHLVADQTFTGIGILFLGPLGILGAVVGWYANPLLLVGLIAAQGRNPARTTLLVLAGGIAVLAASALLWREIPDDSGANPIIMFHAGFWLWLTTMVAAAGWLAIVALSDRPAER